MTITSDLGSAAEAAPPGRLTVRIRSLPTAFRRDGHHWIDLDADACRLAVAEACGLRRDAAPRVRSYRHGEMITMQIGLVGLRRMSANMSREEPKS